MGEPIRIQHLLLLFLLMHGPIQHLLCKPIFGLALLIVGEPILHVSPPFSVMGEPFLIMGKPFLIMGEPISSLFSWGRTCYPGGRGTCCPFLRAP